MSLVPDSDLFFSKMNSSGSRKEVEFALRYRDIGVLSMLEAKNIESRVAVGLTMSKVKNPSRERTKLSIILQTWCE